MFQSYDHWQGDERSYIALADRVKDGNLPYVDWSPGFAVMYAPIVAFGLDDADSQLLIRLFSSVALLAVFGFASYRIFRKPWLAVILTLAIAAHPMLSVGMTLRVFTAALIALIMLASTHERRGVGLALVVIAIATLVRPEFWILYALLLVIALAWYRSRTSVSLIAASVAIALASLLFVQLGPVASNYPGGRALQAIGQHYALFDATPDVDPWNEWSVPYRRDFGNATTALEMYRVNSDRFVAYVSSNLRSMPNMILTSYRYSDRTTVSRLTGIALTLTLVLAAALYLRASRFRPGKPDFTIVVSVLTFSMMLPWAITGTDSMIAAPFSPAILVLAGASALYLLAAVKRRQANAEQAGH